MRRKGQPTPVFLPEKSHGQGSLVGCSPWGHKGVGHDLVTKQHQKKSLQIEELQDVDSEKYLEKLRIKRGDKY